jgi:hypothetical protein
MFWWKIDTYFDGRRMGFPPQMILIVITYKPFNLFQIVFQDTV